MSVLNYSSFAHLVFAEMIKGNMTKIAQKFVGLLIGDPNNVLNENDEEYSINSREAGEWFREKTNIYENIGKAAGTIAVIDNTLDYFYEIIDELIPEQNQRKSLIRMGIFPMM